MKDHKMIIAALGLIFCFGCTGGQDAAVMHDIVVMANQGWMTAVEAQDAAAVAARYTEDAQLMPPFSDIVEGNQAIQAVWQDLFGLGVEKIQLETVEVEAMGKLAYETGKYTTYATGELMLDQGKYIVVWKEVEGQWKLHRDIWNSSSPMPEMTEK